MFFILIISGFISDIVFNLNHYKNIDNNLEEFQRIEIYSQINEDKFNTGPFIDVTTLGAKGDGITNDHPSIQAAFDFLDSEIGGTIFFPEGDYLLNDGITIHSKSNILVTGEQGAKLIVNNVSMFVLHFIGAYGIEGPDRPQNIRIENLTIFDPDPEKHTSLEESHGIRFAGYDIVEVRNTVIINIGDEGIEFTRCRWAVAYGNRGYGTPSVDPGGAFIQSSNSSFVKIYNNYSEDSRIGTSYGVRTPSVIGDGPVDIEVKNNVSLNSQGNGIRVLTTQEDVKDIQIKDNFIKDSALEGINFLNLNDKTTSNIEISSNIIEGGGKESSVNSVRAAILLRSSLVSNVKIVGNKIEGWGDKNVKNHNGIAFRGDSIIVRENVIVNSPGAGILHVSGNNSKIEGNQISGSKLSSGVLVHSGSGFSIKNNISQNNYYSGIEISRSTEDYTIANNEVIENEIGIHLQSRTAPNNFERNIFEGNNVGLETEDIKEFVDARNNWWGNNSGPSGGNKDPITGKIANGFGESIRGQISFDPWWIPEQANVHEVDKIKLNQNFPNPFNTNTVIVYHLPFKTDVRLEIFDSVGRRIAVLVNEQQQEGIYIENFDASHLSTGIYFYRLNTKRLSRTRKMLLVK